MANNKKRCCYDSLTKILVWCAYPERQGLTLIINTPILPPSSQPTCEPLNLRACSNITTTKHSTFEEQHLSRKLGSLSGSSYKFAPLPKLVSFLALPSQIANTARAIIITITSHHDGRIMAVSLCGAA